MASKSTHWGDIHNWIKKVIDSCTTSDQIKSTEVLIERFSITYPLVTSTYFNLMRYRREKWESLLKLEENDTTGN